MSIFEAIVLGIVQGLTEFIPVSSSGHLLLMHEIFGSTTDTLTFDVALHVGTLLALFVYFRSDIITLARNALSKNEQGRLARQIALATIPAALAGFLFNDIIEDTLRSPIITAGTLAGVAVLMLIVDRKNNSSDSAITTKQAMTVGLAQMIALIPGVSRSGITMTAGLFVGLTRKQAARFSFLLAIPIITGSALGTFIKLDNVSEVVTLPLGLGMLAAGLSGMAAIHFLLRVIGTVGLKPFAYYRIVLALIVFVVWM